METINFTGRGNTPEEAEAFAFVRYMTWVREQRRNGLSVEEVNKQIALDQRSSVYCKCELVVEYNLLDKKVK